MNDTATQELGFLARLVLALGLLLIVAGIVWHGITVATFHRFVHNLVERPDGPMRFRFVLQPVMAMIAAVHDGLKDARAGRSPYFVTMLRSRQERLGLLREGVNATARIILLGIAMDVVYQALVLGTFYPNEAVMIALLLAFVPYLVLRGLVRRVGGAVNRIP